MYEAAVVLAGAGVGVSAYARQVKAWSWTVGAIAVVIGFAASSLSGELAESWLFLLIDVAQSWLGAIGGALLAAAFVRWRTSA